MSDFQTALKEGLAAAEKAEISRAEIAGVLESLKKEVELATDGKVTIAVEQKLQYVPEQLSARTLALRGLQTTSEILASMSGIYGFESRRATRSYHAIVAKNPGATGPSSEIAEWKRPQTGYPCTVIWDDVERECQDRESLIGVLTDLLSSASTGSKIKKLIAEAAASKTK